jgi:hypothetical protein
MIIIPEEGGTPRVISAQDRAALLTASYQVLMEVGKGWCYVVEGKIGSLSNPTQVFELRMPDGSVSEIRDQSKGAAASDGRFSVLRPATR